MSTAIAVAPRTKLELRQDQLLAQAAGVLAACGGDQAAANRLMSMVADAIATNPKLMDYPDAELLHCAKYAAGLGLPIGKFGVYMVPRGKVQPEIATEGLVALAFDSGHVKEVQVECVYEGDDFVFEKGSNQFVRHRPDIFATSTDRKVVGAYAIIATTTGGQIIEIMGLAELLKVKSKAQGVDRADSPWKVWPGEMFKKTVLKRAMKKIPKGERLQRALAEEDRLYDQEREERAFEGATAGAVTRGASGTAARLAAAGAKALPAPKQAEVAVPQRTEEVAEVVQAGEVQQAPVQEAAVEDRLTLRGPTKAAIRAALERLGAIAKTEAKVAAFKAELNAGGSKYEDDAKQILERIETQIRVATVDAGMDMVFSNPNDGLPF